MNSFETLGDAAKRVLTGLLGERHWDGQPIIAPGVYAGVPIDTYHREPELFGGGFSISSSGLRTLLRRPAEYWWTSPYNPNAEEPETKQALDFGKAAHMLLLGEHGFAEQYALRPEKYEDDKGTWKAWNANSNACKEWLQKQAEAGKTVITETEIGHIRHMAAALQTKEPVRLGILKGRIERSIFCQDNGIWLKARPDVVPNASGDFVDLKTAASVDDESLSRAIYANGYHVQAGLLRMIVREVLGADAFASFTFVFVEKAPPYDVRVMQLKDSDIDLGERQARYGLKVLRDCLKHKAWPGYDGFDRDISYIEMPPWARTRIDAALNAEAA
ncbi:hypothetical protein GGQ99_001336 [Aminobacter niigataensis]|uniref:Putative exodeoxyribonuclease 8 PDDEXK-like domain-containing protein n=1 Tax=Aminobacter niigataensis TaxID=83265 RepID=A0ABR6KYL3_9HYPH|nr:PD-(D/E)XK nuclease-like domain-containing protein [Aminobacter niigataensis]MBB4649614.1 hypothetical protein [Aminobacter niigataensis]